MLSNADAYAATGVVACARPRSIHTAGPITLTRELPGMRAVKSAWDIQAAFGGEVRLLSNNLIVTNDFPNASGATAWRPPA